MEKVKHQQHHKPIFHITIMSYPHHKPIFHAYIRHTHLGYSKHLKNQLQLHHIPYHNFHIHQQNPKLKISTMKIKTQFTLIIAVREWRSGMKTAICESWHGQANEGMGTGEMKWNESRGAVNNATNRLIPKWEEESEKRLLLMQQ